MDSTPPWLWPGDGLRSLDKLNGRNPSYFAFVEDVVRLSRLDGFEGPDQKGLTELVARIGATPLRFRLAAVATRDFREIAGHFDELDPEILKEGDRDRRRGHLEEFVAEMPIPLLDIYAARESVAARWLGAVLRPGSWHFVVVSKDEFLEDFPPIVMGDPDLLPELSFRGSLAFLGHVFPHLLMRLRDIFSLVHIPDADFEREDGAEPPLRPVPDRGPEGGAAQAAGSALVDRVQEAEEPKKRYMTGGI